jgi:hypothetical protein
MKNIIFASCMLVCTYTSAQYNSKNLAMGHGSDKPPNITLKNTSDKPS